MRVTIVFIAIALLGVAFVAQRNHATKAVTAPTGAAQSATPREVSEHDWAKRSLDTTAKVKRQVIQQRRDDETR